MVSFLLAGPQPEAIELAVPTHITFRAATANKSVFLSVYCHEPERIINLIQRLVQQSGGRECLSVNRVRWIATVTDWCTTTKSCQYRFLAASCCDSKGGRYGRDSARQLSDSPPRRSSPRETQSLCGLPLTTTAKATAMPNSFVRCIHLVVMRLALIGQQWMFDALKVD